MHIPDIVWELVEAEAELLGLSATKVVTLALAAHFKLSKDKLPKPRRIGRPRKPRR